MNNALRGRRDCIAAIAAIACLVGGTPTRAQDDPFRPRTDRLIVKLKDRPATLLLVLFDDAIMARLSAQAGVPLVALRVLGDGAQVLRLPQAIPESDAQAIAARLEALPEVAHAAPDRVMRTQ